MNSEVRQTLLAALETAIDSIRQRKPERASAKLVWNRSEDGGWTGGTVLKPDPFTPDYDMAYWDTLGVDFGQALATHHPEYMGLVGAGCGAWARGWPGRILWEMTYQLWTQYGLDITGEAVAHLVDGYEAFIDSRAIPIQGYAPLLNLRIEKGVDEISLPNGAVIVRLGEREVNLLYGRVRCSPVSRQNFGWYKL